jgi:hypothetical protein
VELPMGAGSHTITARMVDGQGAPQIETSSNPQPGGATGLDSVRVEV